jgi:tetratricopeptide (TPR) repeat protein
LWIALHDENLESLLTKAKELEKKYEWLQAVEYHKKASKSTPEKNDALSVAKLQEEIGFCFSRASFQTNTNEEFQRLMKLAIRNYKKAIDLYQKIYETHESAIVFNLRSTLALLKSWIVTTPSKRDLLINDWWNLKKKAISIFEESKDFKAIGKAYTDLLDDSATIGRLFWLDLYTKYAEYLEIGEKAIEVLSKTQNNYELTRAYSWASFYYGYCLFLQRDEDRKGEFIEKCSKYSKQATLLSKEVTDARVLFEVYNAAHFEALVCQNNPVLALELTEKSINQAIITKDNILIGRGKSWASWVSLIIREENPDKHRTRMEQSMVWSFESITNFEIINSQINLFPSYRNYVESLLELASLAVHPKKRRSFLEKAVNIGQEFWINNKWQNNVLYWASQIGLIRALYLFSKTETNENKKIEILKEIQDYSKKQANGLQQYMPTFMIWRARTQNYLASMETELAKNQQIKKQKLTYLGRAIVNMQNCSKIMEDDKNIHQTGWSTAFYGDFYYKFGEILRNLYDLTGENETKQRAINAYCRAIEIFQKRELNAHAAESYWQIAKIQSQNGNHLKAAKNYELASQAYDIASEKIPPLSEFYNEYCLYMQAWSQIELARNEHSIEDYNEAKKHYEQAAILHRTTKFWNYLAPNYLAWAHLEDAEGLSRKESAQQANRTFQKAFEQFSNIEESVKQKIEEIKSLEEKEMAEKLLGASKFRQKYCRARILMEEAKLLDREGKYLQSSRKYGEAAQTISAIVDKTDVEVERNELKYLVILCQAWQKMAVAEEKTSSQPYLEAAALFEQAKDYCYTKKASLWALGNSSFCRGLAAGIEYQSSADLREHSKAKSLLKSAANSYLQAGFKQASEYCKATQRLFDAYAFMNKAENELDQKKRAEQYQIAENLLQIAAGSFMKAKQPEKTAQVQKILVNVMEEKSLAVSLSEVMQAPTIASSTLSFAAPTPTKEISVGLENFEHENVQANMIVDKREVKVGESFCLSVEFVNAGKESALLLRVDDFVPSNFVIVKKPEIYRIEDTTLNMKGKQLAPLKLVEVKLTLQPSKKGDYSLYPRVQYLDERGQNKCLQLKTLEIRVEEVLLEDRVTTGTLELDSLLLGGVPKEYAVALSGPPCDERELIINNFLKVGVEEGITFYVSTEATGLEGLLENSNFCLFLCNSKPKTSVPNVPNVYKLQNKADITNLGIALTKAYRSIDQSVNNKRVCVEILSDVLLKHGVNTTREWLSGLITDLGAKGFTILAAIDPNMHATEHANAVINLFDGEISVTKTKDPLECKTSIRIEKLRNQDYIKNPICLT